MHVIIRWLSRDWTSGRVDSLLLESLERGRAAYSGCERSTCQVTAEKNKMIFVSIRVRYVASKPTIARRLLRKLK